MKCTDRVAVRQAIDRALINAAHNCAAGSAARKASGWTVIATGLHQLPLDLAVEGGKPSSVPVESEKDYGFVSSKDSSEYFSHSSSSRFTMESLVPTTIQKR